MKKKILLSQMFLPLFIPLSFFSVLFLSSFLPTTTHAFNYEIAVVQEVTPLSTTSDIHEKGKYEIIQAERKNKEIITVETGDIFDKSALHGFEKGQKIIISQGNDGEWIFTDRYRIPALFYIILFFSVSILLFARKKGFFALIGLAITMAVIFGIVIPGIKNAIHPFLLAIGSITLIGAGAIGLSHGFNSISRIALVSIVLTLLLAGFLSYIATSLSFIFGLGSEETWEIGTGILSGIDFRGVFLIGILLGSLGVLDDVTITQVSAVRELKKSNPSLQWKELFVRASRIGKDHLVSVINTLVLAYSASSLPVFLLLSTAEAPWWVLINSELIAEEIIRTIVGSTAIIFAIPLSTFLAAKYFENASEKTLQEPICTHHH